MCMNILPAGMSVHPVCGAHGHEEHQFPGTGAIDGCESCAGN